MVLLMFLDVGIPLVYLNPFHPFTFFMATKHKATKNIVSVILPNEQKAEPTIEQLEQYNLSLETLLNTFNAKAEGKEEEEKQ